MQVVAGQNLEFYPFGVQRSAMRVNPALRFLLYIEREGVRSMMNN